MQQQRQTEEIITNNDNTSITCWVCTDSTSRITRSRNRTLMRGCACRGSDAGFAHLDCLIQFALHSNNGNDDGDDDDNDNINSIITNNERWDACPTCKQDYTGKLRLGLAQARWELVQDAPRQDYERLNAADRLASALQECALDNDAALPLFQEVLEISREMDGNDDVNTLVSMNNLASLHQKIGNYDAALPLFQEALETQQRIVGKNSSDTLRTMSNLAMLYLRTGEFDKALPLASESLQLREEVLGADHVDTLESLHNMGLLRWHMAHGEYVSFTDADEFVGCCRRNELQQSAEFLKRAVEGLTRVLGNQHYQTKMAVRALGFAECKRKELEKKS
mmetsp:Transcript_44051/g.92653  ORF Transcript_44051/g.92653 Transcript_44051/m.92653 type:complete len:337 (-) Transcript_44051:710-1720(-)|eukprot:CAMPEP_0183710608 /NCGR_PEP_ID=MMETSP0737-20130205/6307_1 /TAXON_ID=385413 /ORGANISM="Thalassiosira miniscula, Strain CCMP1093" /LENGTH=336 /DNA_ID=CAMNT_0025938917 /DNA_START=373 /DNA_END=1383 /DNA_ORIENTATION=-